MPRFSRRSFLHLTTAASAATALRFMTEPMFAAAARRRPHAPDAIMIDSNENPLGPCQSARDAMASILPQGGRYSDNLTDDLVSTFAKIEGLKAGCIEALMLNHKGEVAEATGDNIFLVRGGIVQTPPLDAGILEGITRDAVIELARAAGYAVFERSMDRHDIYTAEECFLTGTAAEVIPVVECDGRPIGPGRPGPITQDLRRRFHALVRGEG